MTCAAEGRRCLRACVEGYKFQDADTRVVDVYLKPLGVSDHRLCCNTGVALRPRYGLVQDLPWRATVAIVPLRLAFVPGHVRLRARFLFRVYYKRLFHSSKALGTMPPSRSIARVYANVNER